MKKLIEFRNEELLCRELALSEPERRDYWNERADDWERLALDFIAFHFEECNALNPSDLAGYKAA